MKAWLIKSWPPIVTVSLFLVIWQLSTSILAVEKWILPSPIQVMQEGWRELPKLWVHIFATVKLTLLGFCIGSAIGLVLSVMLHLMPRVRAGLSPLLILSQNIPVIILAPLLMIWFGYGILPKLITISLICFFPVAVAAMDGFARAERSMYNYMQMIGGNKWKIFRMIELPSALPHMFSGLKISATYSVMSAVIAEWLGAEKGLGFYMMMAKSSYRADRVFCVMLLIVLFSLVFYKVIGLLEKWLVRWNVKS
ncbi:ABC transporter permease [Paenibacillus sp. KN14-4R]|uniref:ABC transporter permease n=1 Tax=Paenibacillus sp. KN14-4R TaxID=3445773 RepID=UPI003F9F3180